MSPALNLFLGIFGLFCFVLRTLRRESQQTGLCLFQAEFKFIFIYKATCKNEFFSRSQHIFSLNIVALSSLLM